ncbi:MAG TPA: uroporphyrinogen decarboxylase [Roseiflexaceae bacterium]|nr:uroporphyrinogen decarboxylase [Roseiflexaceae bacterium]
MTNDRFIKACRREPVDTTPVWLMRQAGRYMPEYRAVRERYGFLQMVKTPELAAEVTMQPVRAFDVDAAIVFADILPPLEGMGLCLTYEAGEGPVIHNPVRSAAEIAALHVPDPREAVGYTLEAIRLAKRELAGRIPLIGFSGAPFTLASYAIEGGASREYRRTKQLMYGDPVAWHALMAKLADLVGAYLAAQAEAGADALQLFDSWAGALAPGDYAEYVLPYVQRAIAAVRPPTTGAVREAPSVGGRRSAVPVIYFGTGTAGLLGLLRHTGADVVGLDWRVNLDDAWAQLGPGLAVQGNLDPAALFAPWPEIERRARAILDRAAGRPGHIFNLGHGILTETPVEHVRRLVSFVHSYGKG